MNIDHVLLDLAKTHDNSEGSQVTPGSAATESIAEEVEGAVSNHPLADRTDNS